MDGLQFYTTHILMLQQRNKTETTRKKMKVTIHHNKRPNMAMITILTTLLLVWRIQHNTTQRLHNVTTHGGGGVRVFPVANAFSSIPIPTRTRTSCPDKCTTSDHCFQNRVLTRSQGGRNWSVPAIATQEKVDSSATSRTLTTATIPAVVPRQMMPSAVPASLSPPAQWQVPSVLPHPTGNVDYPPAGITLSQYMMELAHSHPNKWGEMERIFTSLQVACKTLSHVIRTSSLTGLNKLPQDGASGSIINVQGEEQKQLDVIANTVMKQALQWTGKVSTIVSEEEDDPVDIGTPQSKTTTTLSDIINKGPWQDNSIFSSDDTILVERTGRYTAVFDPLDGSSNLEAGIPVGTIFGIFENDPCDNLGNYWDGDYDGEDDLDDDLDPCLLHNTHQPGTHLVAAGYCLYSSATTMVFTMGKGVLGFTYDEQMGEFILTHPHMTIPARGKVYSFNEANRWDWDLPLQKYITDIQQGRGETQTRYSSRYIGSMVADVHRTLQYGGIFGYPADVKNPNGKLRLLYEAAPMAFLIEQAGGMAWTSTTDCPPRIMDISPTSIHQRVPCILGSREDVRELQRYYEEESSTRPDLTMTRRNARRNGAFGHPLVPKTTDSCEQS